MIHHHHWLAEHRKQCLAVLEAIRHPPNPRSCGPTLCQPRDVATRQTRKARRRCPAVRCVTPQLAWSDLALSMTLAPPIPPSPRPHRQHDIRLYGDTDAHRGHVPHGMRQLAPVSILFCRCAPNAARCQAMLPPTQNQADANRTKYQDKLCVENCEGQGPRQDFEQPVWQTLKYVRANHSPAMSS